MFPNNVSCKEIIFISSCYAEGTRTVDIYICLTVYRNVINVLYIAYKRYNKKKYYTI